MVNDSGISIKDAWNYRFKHFFTLKDNSFIYGIFKVLSIIAFVIPFLLFSVLEFIVLTTIKFLGAGLAFIFKILHLSIIWLPLGFLFGVIYVVLNHIFWFLWLICNIVDAVYYRDISYPYSH